MEDTPAMYCYRHPERQTAITCRRCGRPICGECMIPAAVGFQCPQCVKSNTRATRQNQGPYGGQLSRDTRQTSMIIIGINAAVYLLITSLSFVAPNLALQDILGLRPSGICAAIGQNGYWPGVDQATCAIVPNGAWQPGVADGAWWQLITSLFVHFGIWHIAANCLTLWFIGPPLESFLGRGRFIATYLVSGLFGSLAVYWLSDPNSLSGGGSGALFGLMGALLVVLLRQRADVRQLLMWLGLNIVITFVGGNISWQAHLGGLAGGALLACIWAYVPNSPNRARNQWLLVGACLALIIIGLVGRTLMLA